MPFEISGYVLEPIRVGQANSPFTQTPDNFISNQGGFDAAYPSDESEPRTDYLVTLMSEGALDGLLVQAEFGFTKNEVIRRFDYDARAGRFRTLPGSSPIDVGTLAADSNTNRLKVRAPAQAAVLSDAPYRLSVGPTGSGMTWVVTIVALDSSFGSPVSGTVELSLETGNLHWNTSDLTTFAGQPVRFQRQQFYTFTESTGRIGLADDPLLMLNPLPGSGQFPLLRFGFGFYLTAVEVATEGAFGSPITGTFEWAADTGRVNLNTTDAANNAGIPVYYDGVLFGWDLQVPSQVLGDISSPSQVTLPMTAGMDLIFALPGASPYYQFPQFTFLDNALFSSGSVGVVQVDPVTGDVQFSASDQSTYAGEGVTVYLGDLPIERGITIRLFRTPVNLDASQSIIKDVTAIYTVTNAVWADPIIQSPQVFLPSTPIDDLSYPLVVKVAQGQGTFITDNLPRLDVSSPPAGLGYFIDFDEGVLYYAERKEQVLVPIVQLSPDVILPDPLVLSSNLALELELAPGSGTYVPLTLGQDALFDSISGVVSITTLHGSSLTIGSGADVVGTSLTDTNADFVASGVSSGHLVEVLSPLSVSGVYTVVNITGPTGITTVETFPSAETGVAYRIHEGREVLADRFFEEVVLLDPSTKVERIRSLGSATNAPRLNVPLAYVETSSFRLGPSDSGTFTTTVLVPDDGSFTSPPAGTVEISQDTGNVNFATADLGIEAFWVNELVPRVDYILSPGLGLIQFTDRMLGLEEVRVTYTTEPPTTDPPTAPGSPITEYGRFLIRKEITQPHPIPTSTLFFNPNGLTVASTPPPTVFRGGRPQRLGIQCVVDTELSTITFLADSQVTDALPHGATIAPEERVYIDYYVTQAVGGENTITVLTPPMLTALVNINELDANGDPNNQFVIRNGDYTSNFPPERLLRIENEEIYLIGSAVYDSGANTTTVALAGSQTFQDTFTDPLVYVSSGTTPIVSAPLDPSYFVPELSSFEAVARGSKTFRVTGDRLTSYRVGTVVLFTDGGSTFTDFLQVLGASYDGNTDRTEIKLASGAARQYLPGSQLLLYSVRPLFEPPTVEVRTSQVPVLTQPYTIYRKLMGEPGALLTTPQDYTIDESGRVLFTTPLLPNEEFSIFYTGLQVPVSIGINLRATYTCQVVPNGSNGLEGQILLADHFIFSPDSFYYRVETMTNFRGEYAQEIAGNASSGSSGPQTDNASQPQIFEQGRTSVYFDERHLANQDIIARSSLLFYNDAVNSLEDYLQALDGRVVGNNDGRFLFDGTTGTLNGTANQIDDIIQVSPAPYEVTYPPFAVSSIGTFRKYYLPGSRSRFYPTQRDFFAVSAVILATQPGDEVVDTKSESITAVTRLHTRLPWAVVTESTEFSGSSVLKVDLASGVEAEFADQAAKYARPPFATGMECVVQDRDGSFINGSSSPVTITSVSDYELGISGLSGVAGVGSTIYQSLIDTSGEAPTYYLLGRDFGFNSDNGQITYVPEIAVLSNTPLVEGEALSGSVNRNNTLTAPDKFPALYGGIEDDDGELSFPIQTPDPDSEQNGYLATEDKIIHDSTGLIRTLTTPTFEGAGDYDDGLQRITNSGGNWPAPLPEVNDMVRILTGTHGPSDFYRIVAVGADTLDIDTALGSNDTGFSFVVTVSDLSVTGTGDITSTDAILDDAVATFLSDVAVGHTLVKTGTGERRQITGINSNTQLTVSPAFAAPLAGAAYRVDNSLATYGDTVNDYLTDLSAAVAGQFSLYPNEQAHILNFLDIVFTDVATSGSGETNSDTVLDDASATFLTDGVSTTHYVFIQTGADAGFYQITSVNSETQLEVNPPFPATLVGVSYRVVKLFGASPESVDALFSLYLSITTLQTSANSFLSSLASVPVAGFAGNFATGLTTSILDARDVLVDSRLAAIPATVETVEEILANTDKLYDKRYAWIDARINLENGLVAQQAIAAENRVKAQQEFLNELIKLLAVEEVT